MPTHERNEANFKTCNTNKISEGHEITLIDRLSMSFG